MNTKPPVDVLAVMPGWRIQRNTDGSIGVFAPEPKPGESRRTSEAIYPESSGDLSELMFKFFDALLKDEARAAVAELEAKARVAEARLTRLLDTRLRGQEAADVRTELFDLRDALAKFA